MRVVATVGALIANPAGRILLVRTHKWRGLYGLPGGKIDVGERMEEALTREIREETELELEHIRFAMVQESIESPEFHRPAHLILFNYFARTSSTSVQLNEEAQEWCWVEPREALELPLNTFTRVLIEAFLEADASQPSAPGWKETER